MVLGTLTNEAPGDITMNSSTGSGLDMYRRLHVRLDPADMVTSMRWLRTLMSTQPVDSITDLVPAIEKWEDAHRRYSQRKDCSALTEQQKMVSLLGLAALRAPRPLGVEPGEAHELRAASPGDGVLCGYQACLYRHRRCSANGSRCFEGGQGAQRQRRKERRKPPRKGRQEGGPGVFYMLQEGSPS